MASRASRSWRRSRLALTTLAQHVMRQLDAAHIEPLLDAQQPAVDQRRERVGSGARLGEATEQALLGDVLAEAGVREQLVLDDAPHGRRLVGERALVEVAQDAGVRAGEEIEGDLVAALGDARVVQLAADEAQERRLDLRVGELGAAGDEAHDRRGHLL